MNRFSKWMEIVESGLKRSQNNNKNKWKSQRNKNKKKHLFLFCFIFFSVSWVSLCLQEDFLSVWQETKRKFHHVRVVGFLIIDAKKARTEEERGEGSGKKNKMFQIGILLLLEVKYLL